MDVSAVGKSTAEMMEHLEELYGSDSSATVEEVMTIVLVRSFQPPDDEEEVEESDSDEGWSYVHTRGTNPVWVHQLGLIEAARAAVRR